MADLTITMTLAADVTGDDRSEASGMRIEVEVPKVVKNIDRVGADSLRHLVNVSAIGAHAAASFTWGGQHGESERFIMDSGVTFTFIQPNFQLSK